jgi:hypothetical protein
MVQMTSLDVLRADLAAFADDPDEILVQSTGEFIVTCHGEVTAGQVLEDDTGTTMVRLDDSGLVSYRDFLVRTLGRLDVFASRLAVKRHDVSPFIDGPARLSSATEGSVTGTGMQLLESQLRTGPAFTTRVLFLTAEGGLGKTALLRHTQASHANAFLQGQARSLLWHVDLQGRQLVRLSEALMGDLGDLRVSGLWMSAVMRLVRTRSLVVAIDGFDELAAEQGAEDALGALASLVRQLDGAGTIVAASRRTFFDTDEYLKRAKLLRLAVADSCEFNEMTLLPWGEGEATPYLAAFTLDERSFSDPGRTYSEIVAALGGDDAHPIVARPYLLSYIAKGLLRYSVPPMDFIRGPGDSVQSVAAVVREFISREVNEKWKFPDTGLPYLTVDQHMELLGQVAEEMYRAQRDRLSVDTILTLSSILFDEWKVEPTRQIQIAEMIKAHVLLNIPPEGDASQRSFDHPEFRDYFVAWALHRRINQVMDGGKIEPLAKLLSVAQLSDGTARYVATMIDSGNVARVRTLIQHICAAVRAEVRPTYLHLNVGTLVPSIISGSKFEPALEVEAPIVMSSVVLDGTELDGVRFQEVTAVNASLVDVDWHDVGFERCALGELTIDTRSRFDSVFFIDCRVDGLRVVEDGEETEREYAPNRIRAVLEARGIGTTRPEARATESEHVELEPDSHPLKVTRRLLRLFYRTTVVHEAIIQSRLPQDANLVIDGIMPALVASGLAEVRQWHGAGSQQCWALRRHVSAIMAAEEDAGGTNTVNFWNQIRSL